MTHGRDRGPRWLWAAALLVLGCKAPAPEATVPEPTAAADETAKAKPDYGALEFPELLTEMRDPESCVGALIEVADRFGQATDSERSALVAEAVPAMLKLWDDFPELRLPILRLFETVGDPGAAPIWNRALTVDEIPSPLEEFDVAARSVAQTRATASLPTVHAAMAWFLEHPTADRVQQPGAQRLALIEAMIALRDRSSVPVLLEVLKQPVETQPVAVHRRATDALGLIRDPAAVQGLILVPYSIPDVPTTTSVTERSKMALASIGEPAVEPLLGALRGENKDLNELLRRHGIQAPLGSMAAVMTLGAIGSPSAATGLIEAMPDDDCGSRRTQSAPDEDDDSWKAQSRAWYANALGLIGDERAVDPLCRCAKTSREPGELYPITEALSRIGGSEASSCLARVIRRGRYHPDTVVGPEFELEIRWEAARHALLAVEPGQLAQIEAAIKSANRSKDVAKHTAQWDSGIAVLRRCGTDLPCYSSVLADPEQPWFAREVAAMNAARLAPGDADVALQIARAYAVEDPDARVTMAWLTGHMLDDTRCQACADTLQHVLDEAKREGLPPKYQLSVLTARTAIAKLRE
ncbi:MAG: hypothetical protein AAF799_40260 [Myxococcota bacterium]